MAGAGALPVPATATQNTAPSEACTPSCCTDTGTVHSRYCMCVHAAHVRGRTGAKITGDELKARDHLPGISRITSKWVDFRTGEVVGEIPAGWALTVALHCRHHGRAWYVSASRSPSANTCVSLCEAHDMVPYVVAKSLVWHAPSKHTRKRRRSVF